MTFGGQKINFTFVFIKAQTLHFFISSFLGHVLGITWLVHESGHILLLSRKEGLCVTTRHAHFEGTH